MKNLFVKYNKILSLVAVMLTAISVNRGCTFLIHERNLPEGAKKLRKF